MTEKRRRRWPRRLALGIAVFLVLLLLLWVFRFPLFGGLLKDTIGDALAAEGILLEVDDISGSLLADAQLTGVRVIDSTGLPLLRAASVGRVSVSFSLFGLLTGRDDWIREVEIADVRGVIDLAAPPGPDREPDPPSEGGGTTPLPGRVRITGFDVEVRNGEDLLQVVGGELLATRGAGSSYRGSFGAELACSVVAGIERRAEEVRAEFAYDGTTAVVEPFRMNGEDHGRVLFADLSALPRDRIVAELDLPLFGGRIGVKADLDLGGEHPRGDVDVAIARLDPRPVLRFIPGVPADLVALEGTLEGHLSGLGPPGLETIEGSYDLSLTRPAYDGRTAQSLALTGTLEAGTFRASGRVTGPEVRFEGTAAVTGDMVRIDGTAAIPAMDLAVLALSLEGQEIAGVATVTAHAKGPVDSLRFETELSIVSPRFGDLAGDRIVVRASGSLDEILIESLELERAGDRLAIREGLLRLSKDPVEFVGRVDLDLAAIAPYRSWIPAELPEGLEGRLHLEAKASGTPDAPGATAVIRITDARWDDLSVALVEIHAAMPTTDRVLVASLTVDGKGDLPRVEISDAALDLGEAGVGLTIGGLRATREGMELASRGAIQAEVAGERIRFRAPLGAAGVGLEIDAGLDAGDALGGTIRIADVDLETLSRVLRLPVPLAGSATGEIRLGGTTDRPRVDLALDLPDLCARPEGRPEIRTGPIRFRLAFSDGTARLEELLVRGEGGPEAWTARIRAAVPVDLDDLEGIERASILSGEVEIAGLPLSAGGPLPGLTEAEGELSVRLTLGGTIETPTVTGRVELSAPSVRVDAPGAPPVRDLELVVLARSLSRSGGQIEIETLRAEIGGARLDASARVGHRDGKAIDPRLAVSLREANLARVFAALGEDAPIGGSVDLSLSIEAGPIVRLDVKGRDLVRPGFATSTVDLSGAWEAGYFGLDTGRIAFAGGHIDVTGRIPVDLDLERLELGIRGDARPEIVVAPDLDLAAIRLGGNGLRASGRVRGRVESAGTWDHPDARGELLLEHVYVRVPGAPAVDDVNGAFRLRSGDIALEDIQGRLGRGTFRIDGTAARAGLELGSLDVGVQGRDLLVVRDREMTLRADLNCRLTGRAPERLRLSGEVKVHTLRYSADVDYLSTEPGLAPLPLTEDPALAAFELDLVVLIPPKTARIRTNVLDGEIEGRLEVGGTVAVPRPDGRIRVLDGIAKLPTTSLAVERGFVEFRRSEPLRPYVDAGLETTVAGTEIQVQVSGPASGLKIELSSNPPLPRPDILSVLVTGVPRSELGASTLGSVAATLVYRQLTAGLAGDDTGEESDLARLAKRIEVEVDTGGTSGGGTPSWSATLALIDDWFLLRGGQDEPENYGLDLIWRLSFK